MNPKCIECGRGEDQNDTYVCIGCYRIKIGVKPNAKTYPASVKYEASRRKLMPRKGRGKSVGKRKNKKGTTTGVEA